MSVASKVSKDLVEAFLYQEADLLDDWKLMEWSELFTVDSSYLVPSTDIPDGDHETDLFLIADNHHRLVQRAKRLLKKEAHVEFPHSNTRHMYTNIQIHDTVDEITNVTCNFATYRIKREFMDTYVGKIKYKLVINGEDIKIQQKRVVLDLAALRPQGKVSIIL
jgi:p-cumate 2,3-dioxygenase beta subunit